MEAILSGRFIAGVLVGLVLCHLYQTKMMNKGQ